MGSKVIPLAGEFDAKDKRGVTWCVQSVSLEQKGYIPDVRVQLKDRYDVALFDDEAFIGHVMAQLRKAGYAGEPFGRAELGMQGSDFVVLEPCREFRPFAKEKGWRDLGDIEPLPWLMRLGAASPSEVRRSHVQFVFRARHLDGTLWASEDPHWRGLKLRLLAQLNSLQLDSHGQQTSPTPEVIPGKSTRLSVLSVEIQFPEAFADVQNPWIDLVVCAELAGPAPAVEEVRHLSEGVSAVLDEVLPQGVIARLQEASVLQELQAVRRGVLFRAAEGVAA